MRESQSFQICLWFKKEKLNCPYEYILHIEFITVLVVIIKL